MSEAFEPQRLRDTEEEARLNEISGKIVDAAFEVHKTLGPGLLESVYESCLAYEIESRGLKTERQKILPLKYKDLSFDQAYRLDLVVENQIIVELKTTDVILPVHEAQLLSYLKLTGLPLGLLLNFKTPLIKNGIKRIRL
jgi:GxxExxY protein